MRVLKRAPALYSWLRYGGALRDNCALALRGANRPWSQTRSYRHRAATSASRSILTTTRG